MATYYLDSSALVKRYVAETGSAWLQSIVAPATGHLLLTSRITTVEVAGVKALLLLPTMPMLCELSATIRLHSTSW
jgi:predicted nucleic acid-binding protein